MMLIQKKILVTLIISSTFFATANLEIDYVWSASPENLAPKSPLFSNIFKQIQYSVVQITRPSPSLNPDDVKENLTSLGSGFIYDKEGRIITNSHVVGDSKSVDVMFINGSRYGAKVIGKDIFNDIAIVQLDNFTGPIQPLLLGNSSELEIGDQVIAVGNPYGLAGSMTAGIVSQLKRLITAEGSHFAIPDMIQIDALINPGNSGGPLITRDSKVVGMNTAGVLSENGGFSGIGLAIPSNVIGRIVPSLIKTGNYSHPWMGISGETLTPDTTSIFQNLSRNFQGVYIQSIVKDGPADHAGLNGTITDQYGQKRGGDIITKIDGKRIIFLDDLVSYIEDNKKPGDNITVTAFRDKGYVDLKLTLGKKPLPSSLNLTKAIPEYP
jgi:S1-C subfamily serine protease